jgi:MFS family permease
MRSGVYGHILGNRQAQILLGASILAGLSVGTPLAIVLMVEGETGSFADAGAVTAALALSGAATSPLRGRLVDHHGQTRVLPTFAVLSALGLTGLVVAALAGAPVWALAVIAAAAGAATPPFLSALRPLWAELVEHPDQLVGAYALQAILIEIFFIGGPLAAAALIALGSPEAAILALAGAELVGILAFAATPVSRRWRGEPRTVGRAGALASAGMRTLITVDVPVGMLFGILDVAVPAFARAHGAPAAAGAILAALAVGSMVGGIVYGPGAGRSRRSATSACWACRPR